jgi:hypothetical protein
VVEGQPKAPIPGVDDDRGPCVVAGLGFAPRPGDEHGRDRVQAGVAPGVGVGMELAEKLDVERCLFAGFPDRGLLERLAIVDEASGQGPAGRRVLALDEDDAPHVPAIHDLDDDVDRRHGVAEFLLRHPIALAD